MWPLRGNLFAHSYLHKNGDKDTIVLANKSGRLPLYCSPKHQQKYTNFGYKSLFYNHFFMRKSLLLLPILLSFISFLSLTHASSGDITIWNKTYTQSEAQKQIVEPLLRRIQKQKVAKIQARIVSISIKQYTNKQQSAQKQGNTDLANFYSGVVNTLKGKINISSTGSVNGSTGNKENNLLNSTTKNSTKQSPWLNSWAWIWGNGTNDYNGMTQTQKEQTMIRQQVNEDYNVYIQMKLKQSDFLKEIASKYWISSYAYQYAQTLSFGSPTTRPDINNNWWATTEQTGLTWIAAEQNQIRWQVNTTYRNVSSNPNITKAQFLVAIASKYWTSSYAYEYAQTLNFGSLDSVNKNNAWGTTTDQTGLSWTAQEQSIIKWQINTIYNNVKNTVTKTQFLQAIAEDFGWTSSYAYQYAQTLSFGSPTTRPDINNNWWATTVQWTLTGVALEHNKIEGDVRITFYSYKQFWATKQQFLNEVAKSYPVGSYGYIFAQSLSY